MDRDEERRIIAQVCAGDTNAFEALVVAYQKQVYNLALRTVGNEEDAADMTQEVFLRAYRALGTFRGESKFSVWLYRLTTNVCIDFLRSRRRHPTVSLTASEDDDEQPQFDLPADESVGPEQQLTRSEMRRSVARGLDSLPDDARKILILRELDGLSYAEIGKVLHLEAGTVKSRLFRARHVQPTPIRRAAQPRPAARKRPAAGRTSPLLPISVMAACLALILGATLWFVPHRSQPSGADTALDNAQAPTVTLSPSVKEEDADGRKQDSLPAPESAPVLDDSVSSLLFSVPAESSADSTTLHISDRKTIEALSALLVRTQPVQPLDADRTPLCVLEETSADGVTTRVTVWCDGKDVVFISSTDTQYYRVPDAAAEFCRLTGLPEN